MAAELAAPEAPLAHLIALDLAVAALDHLSAEHEPAILVGASTAVADEAAARIATGPLASDETPAQAESRPDAPGRALWFAPQRRRLATQARELDARLRPGGVVAVIGGGPLTALHIMVRPVGAGFPPETADARAVARLLGYETVARWWLFGPRSVAWALLRLLAERIARDDLVDRCEAAFQSSLIESGRPFLWSISVWVGRKPRSG